MAQGQESYSLDLFINEAAAKDHECPMYAICTTVLTAIHNETVTFTCD